jgi:hypothetical protein
MLVREMLLRIVSGVDLMSNSEIGIAEEPKHYFTPVLWDNVII